MSLTRWAVALLVILGLVGGASSPGYGVTLDRKGTGSPPDYFVCHPNIQFQKAGGKPYFKIELKGFCGIHPGGGLPGWTPVDWMEVKVFGNYNYDTGVAEEDMWAGPKVVLASLTQCPKNPWIHHQPCQVTKVTNETGVNIPGPFPRSAWMISGELAMTLQKWEASYPPKDELEGWQPYSPSGPAQVAVVKPTLNEPIPAGASSFNLELTAIASPTPSWIIEVEWAKIGHPKDPSIEIGGSWTYGTPAGAPKSAAWSQFPLPVPAAGVFAPGLYVVRAKVKTSPDWTDWRHFWVGQPDPTLEQYAKVPAQGQFDFSKIKKVLVIGKGEQKLMEISQAAKLLAKQGMPAQKAVLPRAEAQAEAARDLDALTKRLTPHQQDPEGRLLLREVQGLQRDLAAGPQPGEADRLRRDAQRLSREVDRLEADFLRQQQRAAAGGPAPSAPAKPEAPAEGPQPGQPSGPPQVAAVPRPAPARDPVAEQAAKELETLAKRLTALGANPEAQRFLREVQLLQRRLGSDPGQAPAILKEAQRLDREVDRLEAGLRQPAPPARRAQ